MLTSKNMYMNCIYASSSTIKPMVVRWQWPGSSRLVYYCFVEYMHSSSWSWLWQLNAYNTLEYWKFPLNIWRGLGKSEKRRNKWWHLSTLTHYISLRIRRPKSHECSQQWDMFIHWGNKLRVQVYESKCHQHRVPRGSDTSMHPCV